MLMCSAKMVTMVLYLLDITCQHLVKSIIKAISALR